MRLTVSRDKLLPLVSQTARAVDARNTIPILSNLLLSAAGEAVSVTGTNLDIWCTGAVAGVVEKPGTVTIDAALLLGALKSAAAGSDVSLSLVKGVVDFKAGRVTAKLPTLPADEFAGAPSDAMSFTAEIPAADLRRMISATRYAVCTEATRYYITGVFFHAMKDGGRSIWRAVATNSNQLALSDTDAPAFAEAPDVIVPGSSLDTILALLPEEGMATVSACQTLFRVECGGGGVTTKVIEASFPDYMRVIPRSNPHRARVVAADLDRAFRSALLLAKDTVRSVRLNLEPGRITVSARDIHGALISQDTDADYDGEPFDVSVNGRQWTETLSRLNGGDAEIIFADSASPILLGPFGDDSQLTVQMPLRC